MRAIQLTPGLTDKGTAIQIASGEYSLLVLFKNGVPIAAYPIAKDEEMHIFCDNEDALWTARREWVKDAD